MNTPQVQYAFFLGGQDAEMATIRELLLAEGYSPASANLFDANLTWGAKLSSYQEPLTALPADITPVLIELEPDIPIPPHAVIIDHHNDRAGKDIPTSLEQIAALLGKELTRRQMLIAANDKGHSKGMRQADATEEEIEEIRRFDRLCQGVTEEEERAAEELCAARAGWITLPQSTILIPWNFPHTSPLVDRITPYYSNILIWSDSGRLFFTGKGSIIHKLTEHFRTVEHASKPYFGGNLPEEGFWGISVSTYKSISDAQNLISNILELL